MNLPVINAVTLYTVSCDVLCPSHHHASHTHPLCSFIFTALWFCTVWHYCNPVTRAPTGGVWVCLPRGCFEPLGSPLGYTPKEWGPWVLRHVCIQLYKLTPNYIPTWVSHLHAQRGSMASPPRPHPLLMRSAFWNLWLSLLKSPKAGKAK